VEHTVAEMLSRGTYGLALGYEDLDDHEQLRSDPLLALLSCKRELEAPLAGKRTLNQLEPTGRAGCYHKIGYSVQAVDRLLVDLYIESHSVAPQPMVWTWTRPMFPCTVISRSASFCREELMAWCEANRVDYLFGVARNQRLRRVIGKQMHEACR
jgi:Transposase DDE domain group 1